MSPRRQALLLLAFLPMGLGFFVKTGEAAGWLACLLLDPGSPDQLRLALWILQTLGLGIPCLGALLLLRPSLSEIGIRLPAPGVLLLAGVGTLGLWIPLLALDTLRARLLSDPSREALFFDLIRPGWGGSALVFASLAVLPALWEELAFRGILQSTLSRAWGARVAIPLAALAFAGFHRSAAQFLVPLLLGLALGWLRWRTDCLWIPCAAHALHNALTIGAMQAHEAWFRPDAPLPHPGGAAAGFVLAAGAAWGLARLTRGPLPSGPPAG